jgi:hypothetical protein
MKQNGAVSGTLERTLVKVAIKEFQVPSPEAVNFFSQCFWCQK